MKITIMAAVLAIIAALACGVPQEEHDTQVDALSADVERYRQQVSTRESTIKDLNDELRSLNSTVTEAEHNLNVNRQKMDQAEQLLEESKLREDQLRQQIQIEQRSARAAKTIATGYRREIEGMERLREQTQAELDELWRYIVVRRSIRQPFLYSTLREGGRGHSQTVVPVELRPRLGRVKEMPEKYRRDGQEICETYSKHRDKAPFNTREIWLQCNWVER